MAQTYKVKKGDTLSGIAQKYGVGVGDITGYRSGNKDLIFPDEQLTIGKQEAAPAPKSSGNSYVDEVRTQLSDTGDKTDTGGGTDEYGLSSLRSKITDTTAKRDAAFSELKDISTKTFNDEYEKRGLAEKKARLATIDSEINAEKAKRDEAIAKVRANPGLSAAQMTGDVKKLADYQNDVINTKIAERNAVANEYNTGLSEIDKIVENTVKDKTLDYGYYDSTLKDLTGQVSEYSKNLREDLQNETKSDQFDRQLAQALEIAQMNANKKGGSDTTKVQLVRDPRTGDPLYWFDPETQEISYVNPEDAPGGGGQGGDSFDALDKALQKNKENGTAAPAESTFRWYNPLTWF